MSTLCQGREATIVGNEGNDVLTGSAGPDVIAGLGGDDEIDGLNGADWICGGAGDDTLTGGGGQDRMLGGEDADVLDGGPGTDTASYADHSAAQPVTVTATGNISDDGTPDYDGPAGALDNVLASVENLIGGSGADSLRGNGKANLLVGGLGADSLRGFGGNDTLNAQDGIADTTINCGAHDDAPAIIDAGIDRAPVSCG